MPELPEVEILKNELKKIILDKEILSVQTSAKKLKRPIPNLNIVKEVILKVYRRNKYLIFETTHQWLVFHLGMTGKLIYTDKVPQREHIHCILSFTDGSHLYYHDPRRFGSIDLYSKKDYKEYSNIPLFNKLGAEPLDSQFLYPEFSKRFNTTKNVKSFLMEAKNVCGIGNIYACEILFLAKINPCRKSNTLSEFEKQMVFKLIPQVLQHSIDLGGSSISDYVHTNGQKGTMQNYYYTYGRVGEKCKVCKTSIERIRQSGRSTFYCPTCQK